MSSEDNCDLVLPAHLTPPTCPPAPQPTEGLSALESLMQIRAESTRLAERHRDALRNFVQRLGRAKATCDVLELALRRNIDETKPMDAEESMFAKCQGLDQELNKHLAIQGARTAYGSIANLQALLNANNVAMKSLGADIEKHQTQMAVWRRTLAATTNVGMKLQDIQEKTSRELRLVQQL